MIKYNFETNIVYTLRLNENSGFLKKGTLIHLTKSDTHKCIMWNDFFYYECFDVDNFLKSVYLICDIVNKIEGKKYQRSQSYSFKAFK